MAQCVKCASRDITAWPDWEEPHEGRVYRTTECNKCGQRYHESYDLAYVFVEESDGHEGREVLDAYCNRGA